MVDEFNKAAFNQGLSEQEMHAVVGNLVNEDVDGQFDGPAFWDFDIAVVGLGFHHFDDPGLAAKVCFPLLFSCFWCEVGI